MKRARVKVVRAAFRIVAAVLIAGAASLVVSQIVLLLAWPRVQALILDRELVRRNDENGYLTFVARAKVRYEAAGSTVTTDAESPEASKVYADVRKQVDGLRIGSSYPVRYSRANPQQARIGAGLSLETWILALVLVVIAAILWKGASAVKDGSRTFCASCKGPVERRYTYCPFCAVPLKTPGE